MDKPVWKMGKREAGKTGSILLFLAILCLIVSAQYLWFFAVVFGASGVVFLCRLMYLFQQDEKYLQQSQQLSHTAASEPDPAFQPKAARQDGIFNPGHGPNQR